MLTTEEIKMFIDEDSASMKKKFARTGNDILTAITIFYSIGCFIIMQMVN